MTGSIKIHAIFSVAEPQPLFVVGVEVISGNVASGMYVHLPLNEHTTFTVQIISIGTISNAWKLPLVGLCLHCAEGNVGRGMNESLVRCDDVLHVDTVGGV
jgi:hypothetical protein